MNTVSVRIYEKDIINFLDEEKKKLEVRGPGQRRTESYAAVVHRLILEIQTYRLNNPKEKEMEMNTP